MKPKEKPIKKERLSSVVMERLNTMIRSGELAPGDRLPVERALAESMGVSRTVIREALHMMEEKGVLEIKNGRPYVRQLSFDEMLANISGSIVSDAAFAKEIMEVRTVLEVYIAKKAVENITPEQIDALQNNIDLMKKAMDEGEHGYTLERNFHRGLVEATGNNALKSIYMLCEDLLSRTQSDSWRVVKTLGFPNTALSDHQAILDAIRRGNANQTEMLVQAHMDYATQNLSRVLQMDEDDTLKK